MPLVTSLTNFRTSCTLSKINLSLTFILWATFVVCISKWLHKIFVFQILSNLKETKAFLLYICLNSILLYSQTAPVSFIMSVHPSFLLYASVHICVCVCVCVHMCMCVHTIVLSIIKHETMHIMWFSKNCSLFLGNYHCFHSFIHSQVDEVFWSFWVYTGSLLRQNILVWARDDF